jgi:hypothetical protein
LEVALLSFPARRLSLPTDAQDEHGVESQIEIDPCEGGNELYRGGTAHFLNPDTGDVAARGATEQQALINLVFGRNNCPHALRLSRSDIGRPRAGLRLSGNS